MSTLPRAVSGLALRDFSLEARCNLITTCNPSWLPVVDFLQHRIVTQTSTDTWSGGFH